MKTWAKVAIGCLAALVVLCIIAIVVAFFGGAWLKNKFGGLFGGAIETGKNVAAIQQLDQQYPFTQPADGALAEDRLQAFLGVCQKVKTVADPLKEDLKAMGSGDKPKMEDAKRAMAATSALTQAFKEGLEQAQMSPAEFRWVEQTAYAALEEGAGTTGGEIQGQEGFEAVAKASLEPLEAQLNDPSLTAEQKEALQGQINEIKATMAPATSTTSPNAALAETYRQQLESWDVREFVAMGLSSSGG